MKLEKTALASLKRVVGVFSVHPVIPNQALTLRQGRNGPQLVQREGERVFVVAVADDKSSLLSFAATNGFPVKNHTDIAPHVPNGGPEKQPLPAAITIDL